MFRTRRRGVKIVAIAIVVVAIVGTAGTPQAGMIFPGVQTGSGPGGSGNGFVNTTVALNNDNSTTASPNFVSLAMTFNALGPIDYGFVVVPSTGTTEYLFGHLTFNNVTGVSWTDFHLELLNAPTGLDFDTPDKDPTPTSSAFTTLNHQPTTIDWSGGALPSGTSMVLTFSVDVPDLATSAFILRSLPTVAVPEPASLLLLGFGFVGLGAWRRYRSQG